MKAIVRPLGVSLNSGSRRAARHPSRVLAGFAALVGMIGVPMSIPAAAPALRADDAASLAAKVPLFDLPYLLDHRNDAPKANMRTANTLAPPRFARIQGNFVGPHFSPTAMHFKECCFATSIVAADLTGQGRNDLIVGNGMSYDVSVLLSDGAGGYLDAFSLPVDNPVIGYVSVAVGDVTGDGKPDIVATGYDDSTILVFAGDGIGNFGVPLHLTTGAGQTPTAVAVGDVDGDGTLDIVTTNGDSGDISVLLADGTGGFSAATTFAAGSWPAALAIGDVTGDGKLDVVTANGDGDDASLLVGDGAGSFAAPVSHSIGANAMPRAIAIADASGDGIPDILTANATLDGSPFPPPELPGTVSILVNDGSGSFAAAVQKSAGAGQGRADAVEVADVTGDGHADIVLSRPNANSAAILVGDGAGNYADAVLLPTGIGPSAMTVADATGDGHLDVVTANQVGSNLSILPGDGEGNVGFWGNFGAGSYPHSIATVDLNEDGIPDVVTANAMSNDVSVLIGDGFGGFAAETHYSVVNTPTSIAVGDFNEDGHQDVVAANLGDNTVSVLAGDGTGSLARANNFSIGEGFQSPYAVAVGDANDDGHLDIVTANTNVSNESVSVLIGDGTGNFAAPVMLPPGAPGLHQPQGIVLADVTGDGHADIVTANSFSNDLSLFAGDGAGNFADAISVPTDLGPVVVAAGDLNGDGIVDLVTVNQTAQTASVLIGTGGGAFEPSANYAIYPDETVQDFMPWPWGMTLADVTGDGKLDIVTANTQNDTVSVLPNDGAGGFAAFFNFDTGAHPGSVAVADVNGDGLPDIVTANRDNNDISVLGNQGTNDAIFSDGFDIIPI